MTAQEVAELMKMGSWRVGRLAIPQIELLVSQIEAAVRDILPDVRPARLSDSLSRFMYMDTMDIRNTHSMAHNLPNPEKSDPAWPRMQIENRAYESFCFRKLHIEVAIQQDGLQVLHCVMFPRNVFDIPILSLDMVAYNGRPTFAIVDPCPVSRDLSLPKVYAASVTALQQKYDVRTNSDIPEWGKKIFSKFCIQMRPESPEDVGKFLKYTLALVHFHLQFARLALPVTADCGKGTDKTTEIYDCHARFSAMQISNEKTRQILEKRFGAELAREYMEQMMFDLEEQSR